MSLLVQVASPFPLFPPSEEVSSDFFGVQQGTQYYCIIYVKSMRSSQQFIEVFFSKEYELVM